MVEIIRVLSAEEERDLAIRHTQKEIWEREARIAQLINRACVDLHYGKPKADKIAHFHKLWGSND